LEILRVQASGLGLEHIIHKKAITLFEHIGEDNFIHYVALKL